MLRLLHSRLRQRSNGVVARTAAKTAALRVVLLLSVAQSAAGHEVVPPKPLVQPAPTWPSGVTYAHDVVVPIVLTVDENGSVRAVQVEARVSDAFDAAAIEVALRWRFEPARSNTKPVPAKVRGIVRFIGSPTNRHQTNQGKPAAGGHSIAAPMGSGAALGASSQPLANGAPPLPLSQRVKHEPRSLEAPATRDASLEVEVLAERSAPPRSASEVTRTSAVIRAAPHRTAGDVLQVVPGMFITQHSGQGKAYQVFYRGFDAVHGQDLEFWVGGAPVNEVSNVHGQGYADLHFVMPEVISKVSVLPGNYHPEQGDFAVAGSVRYALGYGEPGLTVKGSLGSFGERRAFLAYRERTAPPESFAAFETQSTDGFGPSRAAQRSSAILQRVFELGRDRLRVLATGYAARFDSPGVVALRELQAGTLDRFATYGIAQGGFSSRYQVVAEYSGRRANSDWSISPYYIDRGLELRQNYTGYLLDESMGDSTQLVNDSSTFGFVSRYRRGFDVLGRHHTVEAGISLRHDGIQQSQHHLGSSGAVADTLVAARIRALDTAGWLNFTVSPSAWLQVHAGVRADALAFRVSDDTTVANAPSGPTSNGSAGSSGSGPTRTSMGTHIGPRASLDARLAKGLHGLLSFGQGFRSPQARSLGHGEQTPFTKVRSVEAGLRYARRGLTGSVSLFRTTLKDDLVFDAITMRNERVPASARWGTAIEYTIQPASWFISTGSGTFTRASFTQSDQHYSAGDALPYVPQWVLRQDVALTPKLGRLGGSALTGRFGASLTGLLRRPQPYGDYGHDVFLVDAVAELRVKALALGLDVFNLLDARWYDSEFTYSANFDPGGAARLVPERYVTVGAPRTLLASVTLFVD